MARLLLANFWMTAARMIVVVSVALVFFSACVLAPVREPAPVAGAFPNGDAENRGPKSWWTCRFVIHWPADEAPDFTVDLLLAHSVVAPVLKAQSRNIDWWRFHRRAARDAAGHRFSFLFYAEPRVAAEVFEAISRNPILQQALAVSRVDELRCDDPRKPEHGAVEALSDPEWSEVMQRNWPYFIMGVSSLWLAMIDDLTSASTDTAEGDLSARMDAYRRVESTLNALWRKEGQHALLHHLNAMFGYEPILIRKNLRF